MNDDTTPPIQVSSEGTNRVLRIGDLTINVDTSQTKPLESQPEILFDFDKFVVRLIVLFDRPETEPIRDALMIARTHLEANPAIVKELGKLCESCVVIDPRELVAFDRKEWDGYLKKLERVDHPRLMNLACAHRPFRRWRRTQRANGLCGERKVKRSGDFGL